MRGRWGRVVVVGACTAAVASSLATVLPVQAASVHRHASDARPAAPLITSVAGRGLGILVDWAPASVSETVTSYELTAAPVVTASVPSMCKKAPRASVAGDSTMTILTGVCTHVAYRVTISATTSSGTSAWSRSSDPVVPLPATAPFVPLVTSVLGRDRSLDVEWAPPSYDGGKPLTGFLLTAASSSGSKTIHESATSNRTTITGLHDGTSYRVELWAENAVGKSPMATSLGTPSRPHDPGVPTNLSVIPGSGRGSMDVSWTAPSDDGDDAITGYRLTSLEEIAFAKGKAISYRPAPAAKPVTRIVRDTSSVVTGLKSTAVFYVFKVAATTKAGTSAPTSYSQPVTLRTAVRSGTKVLSTSVLSALRSSSGGTLTWVYPSPRQVPAILRSLKPGNVLAAGISKLTPDGLLRTVTLVKVRKPSTYVVSTGPTSLSSAFSTLTTDISLGSSPSNPAISGTGAGRFVPAGPGIAARVIPHAAVSTTLALSLDYSAQVSNSTSTEGASLDVEGEVDLTPSLDLEASLLQDWAGIPDGADLSFTALLGVTESDSVSASGTLQQQWGLGPGSGLYPPALPDIAPQAGDYCSETYVVMLGLVPLVLTPCVEINVTLSATGKLDVTSSTSFLYGEEAAWSSTDPDTLTLTNLSQVPSTNAPPSTSVLATGEGSLGLDVKPELFLDGVTGPYIDASVALVADISPAAQPWFTLDLKLGIAAGWQVVIDFLGINVQVQAAATLSWTLYQSTGPPPVSLAPPLSVSPPSATVAPGASQQFSAPGATGAVTWTLAGAAGDRITSAGLFTAAAPVGRQVVVTATDSSGGAGTSIVTIGPGIGPPQSLVGNVNASGTVASLTWKPPIPVSGETVSSYSVSTSPETVVTSEPGTASGATIGGLLPGTSYVVSVVAWTASGFESQPTTVLLSTWMPPMAPHALGGLSGIACTRVSDCWAVGWTGSSTLVEHWDGSQWSVVPSPSPAPQGTGVFRLGLAAVACTSSSDCWTVGNIAVDNKYNTLIEHWDGLQWSIAASPDPSGSSLEAVACTGSSDCWAVGAKALKSFDYVPLVEHWNGSHWSIVSSPSTPPGESGLTSIACTGSSDCWAVGSVPAKSPLVLVTLIEHWNGLHWSVVSSPNEKGSVNLLSGIACPNTSTCMAVGDGGTEYQTLAERWNGSTWSIVPSPALGNLGPVGCASAAACVTVGFDGDGPALDGERWNGLKWGSSGIDVGDHTGLNRSFSVQGKGCGRSLTVR